MGVSGVRCSDYRACEQRQCVNAMRFEQGLADWEPADSGEAGR